ncbi:unnamed protein product [Lactuca virosa]|uniref:Uncharacterized protein n=1 Tax=Lactuca virosa TaxID=75947 RepID=A0AAU9NLJ4_9ASTR|nr:unnamed protein product [Lactuca virosa]
MEKGRRKQDLWSWIHLEEKGPIFPKPKYTLFFSLTAAASSFFYRRRLRNSFLPSTLLSPFPASSPAPESSPPSPLLLHHSSILICSDLPVKLLRSSGI